MNIPRESRKGALIIILYVCSTGFSGLVSYKKFRKNTCSAQKYYNKGFVMWWLGGGGGGGGPAKMRKILDLVLQKQIHRLASLIMGVKTKSEKGCGITNRLSMQNRDF